MEKYAANVKDEQEAELRQVREMIASYEATDGELSKAASTDLADLKVRLAELEEAIAGHEAGF